MFFTSDELSPVVSFHGGSVTTPIPRDGKRLLLFYVAIFNDAVPDVPDGPVLTVATAKRNTGERNDNRRFFRNRRLRI